MRDLAPEITRQRLLIEGTYAIEMNQSVVESYLLGVASHLNLRTYGKPMIHAPSGLGKVENEGFDAFIPLIDSGISLYVWSSAKFFATVLFTCKTFDVEKALTYTTEYFNTSDFEYLSF
jgi:S-adenosylmethionine decarboxylase